MSDRLGEKCKELGVSEEAFRYTRKTLKKAQEAATEASDAMEADLTNLAGTVLGRELKELRQAAEVLLIDAIMKALVEE